MEIYHVVPINDIRPHKEDGTDCPCLCDLEQDEYGNTLVIHYSYDGRELREGGSTATNYRRVLDVRKLIMERLENDRNTSFSR